MLPSFSFFFFNDTATTEIYTLSLHDALPIYLWDGVLRAQEHPLGVDGHHLVPLGRRAVLDGDPRDDDRGVDRKSTRLNSSHLVISYAVFCLKKKNKITSCFISLTPHYILTPG